MSRETVGARQLEELRERLSGRDLAVVGQIADLRLMSSRQVQVVHFPNSAHDNPRAAAQACQRCLSRLTELRLLIRTERRIGGVRAGSAAACFALGPVGQRVLGLGGPRRRFWEPSAAFAAHSLAVSQLVVDLTLAARAHQFDLLVCQAEPRCWRTFNGLGRTTVLKPDLFVALGDAEMEYRFFCEVDRGSEHLPVLINKCLQYEAYYRSGTEQQRHGVSPRTCWIVPDEVRADRLHRAIAADRHLTTELFVVTTTGQALRVLAGGTE